MRIALIGFPAAWLRRKWRQALWRAGTTNLCEIFILEYNGSEAGDGAYGIDSGLSRQSNTGPKGMKTYSPSTLFLEVHLW